MSGHTNPEVQKGYQEIYKGYHIKCYNVRPQRWELSGHPKETKLHQPLNEIHIEKMRKEATHSL